MLNAPERILIVENADSLREVISAVLHHEGFSVDTASSAEDAFRMITNNTYSCIVSEFKLPVEDGISLLKKVRDKTGSTPFLLMTAFGSIDIAVEAMKEGANDFLTKPIDVNKLGSDIRDVIKHRRVLDRSLGTGAKKERIFISENPKTIEMLNEAKLVAKVDTPVLILGESGTGKELIARYIHSHSRRNDRAFVAVNCGAIPAELLESEFFGHEAGAFTGATQSRVGVFEYASDGSVFLDEIAEMPALLQVKILRAVQEQEVRRVGGNSVINASPRIISATNRPITGLNNGLLREDLYYRIAVVTLTIPPLRERKEDIIPLAQYFLRDFSLASDKEPPKITGAIEKFLLNYTWPGNVRELENVMQRVAVLNEGEIKPEDLGISPNFEIITEAKTLLQTAAVASRSAEVDLITETLSKTKGNKTMAAKLLGVSYKTLLNKVKTYGI